MPATANGIAGPMVPTVAACEWCSATVTYDPERDVWIDAYGRVMCTPEARGATCAWAGYRAEGIEPTTLLNHDGACTCQFAFPHHGRPTAVYAGAVPVCCGRPMRAMTAEWRCRSHCGRIVLPGEPCEVYLAATATPPGLVISTWHGPHPHRGITETEVAGPGAVNTAAIATPDLHPFPLRGEGGVAVTPPKPGEGVEIDHTTESARPPRATPGDRDEGGNAIGSRNADSRPPVQRRHPRV